MDRRRKTGTHEAESAEVVRMRIEFISAGFKGVLNSPGVESMIRQRTEEIRDRANSNLHVESEGFASKVFTGAGQGRVVGVVYTTDHASRAAEAEEKALSRAVR